jgi:hypothetical protein
MEDTSDMQPYADSSSRRSGVRTSLSAAEKSYCSLACLQ